MLDCRFEHPDGGIGVLGVAEDELIAGTPSITCAHGGSWLSLVLDHHSPVPLHHQLADLLRGQIVAGELAARVPSILSLAQEHGVSHRTAAHALTTLREEGLIISVRGKGYYVAGGASGR